MPEVILFDLFGVIALSQSADHVNQLVEMADAPAAEFWDAYWSLRPPYDRGEVNGHEYWARVAETLGLRLDAPALVEADIASWSAVDTDMTALLGELNASGRRLALLSNIPEESAAYFERHHTWLDLFEVRAFSCRIGHAKPSPEAYQWCLDALSVAPGGVLFVDDREENIQAAKELGMDGHLFTDPARLRTALN